MPFKVESDAGALEKLEKITGALERFKNPSTVTSCPDVETVAEIKAAIEDLNERNPEALKLAETRRLLGVED